MLNFKKAIFKLLIIKWIKFSVLTIAFFKLLVLIKRLYFIIISLNYLRLFIKNQKFIDKKSLKPNKKQKKIVKLKNLLIITNFFYLNLCFNN